MSEQTIQNNDAQEKQIRHSKRYFLFFIVVMVPVFSIAISIFLTKKDINLGSMVLNGFKSQGDFLGESTKSDDAGVFSAFENSLRPLFTTPTKVAIKGVGISAEIVNVNVDDEGVMLTPKQWSQAGWYKHSGRPGENRNVVINGHYDDATGAPAAFNSLSKVRPGDTVEIEDNYGRIFNYKVLESKYVDIDDPARLKVLEDETGKAKLTLITCGGIWIPEAGYSKRLIVTAELFQ